MAGYKTFLILFCSLIFAVNAFAEELVWIDGKLPAQSTPEGKWIWDGNVKQDKAISHTAMAEEGISIHSFRTELAAGLKTDSKIIQYVFLDPKNPPSGIMMKFLLDGQERISVYWESDEEAFAGLNEYTSAWYMGPLPERGKWRGLELNCWELEIEKARLKGISFVAAGGRLWWGKTVIERGEK